MPAHSHEKQWDAVPISLQSSECILHDHDHQKALPETPYYLLSTHWLSYKSLVPVGSIASPRDYPPLKLNGNPLRYIEAQYEPPFDQSSPWAMNVQLNFVNLKEHVSQKLAPA
jgi:hypothetical protein